MSYTFNTADAIKIDWSRAYLNLMNLYNKKATLNICKYISEFKRYEYNDDYEGYLEFIDRIHPELEETYGKL